LLPALRYSCTPRYRLCPRHAAGVNFFWDPLIAGVQALQTSPCWTKSPAYIRAVPTFDLPDDELAAVTAAIRRVIDGDRYPHAPRLDPLRAALARLEAASKPTPDPKASPPAKAPAPKISPGFKLGRLPPDR
jgi:hypothetical protein